MSLLNPLPDWSASINPSLTVDYSALQSVALNLMNLSPKDRDQLIQDYSDAYCMHDFNLPRASGMYLLLRVLFELPMKTPKPEAKNFGGWMHPSIQDGTNLYNLSWPVDWETNSKAMKIAKFTGYFGHAYDAIGEFHFFKLHFKYRRCFRK